MRLRTNPIVFVLKLVVFLVLTYLVWERVAPYYLRVLVPATRAGVWLSELSFDPLWRTGTTILTKGTGIYYAHRNFAAFTPPLEPQGIPGDWIMANVVLLVALMLATPEPTWRARVGRFVLAIVLVLVLQVVDIVVAIKVAYTGIFYGYWSAWLRKTYQFVDAFFQSFDTQLFPFAIWAGIHFRELIWLGKPAVVDEGVPVQTKEESTVPRAERRREKREKQRSAARQRRAKR
jgi:hypothetical protein